MNLERLKEHARTLWASPPMRMTAGALLLVIVGGYAWISTHDTPLHPSTPQPNAAKAETTQKGFGAQSAMTMSEVDALLAQMRECWNPPAGAPNPEKLIVQVRVFLTQDGHLERPAQLLTKSSDPYMRSAGEAALRAVNVCEPYKMPVDKYSSWHEIELTFDPSKMVGR